MHTCKTTRQSLRGAGSHTSSSLLSIRQHTSASIRQHTSARQSLRGAGRISRPLRQRAQPELRRLRRRNCNRNCADLRNQVPRTRAPMLKYAGVCAAA
jgi:hypothetical protein